MTRPPTTATRPWPGHVPPSDDAPRPWPGYVPPEGDEPPAWAGEVGAGRTGAGRGGWSPPGGPERPAYGWDPRVPAPPPRRLARSSRTACSVVSRAGSGATSASTP